MRPDASGGGGSGGGAPVEYEVSPTETVGDLKRQIQNKEVTAEDKVGTLVVVVVVVVVVAVVVHDHDRLIEACVFQGVLVHLQKIMIPDKAAPTLTLNP